MKNPFVFSWKMAAWLSLSVVVAVVFSATGHALPLDNLALLGAGVGGMYDKVSNVQNVRPGGVAIITLPCNVTYDKIKLKLGGGLVAADITKIEGKANGKTFMVDTATRAKLRQAYKTKTVDAAWVTLDFTEPDSRGGAASQFAASIPANLLSQLTFEVTIDAGANALSTLECHTEFRAPTNNPFIRKLIDFNVAFAAAGEHDLFLPSGSVGGIIKRIWLHGTDKITAWDLRVNRLSARRAVLADWKFEQKENGLTPQATMDVLDFVADGNIMQGALNTGVDAKGKVPSVELRVTVSSAETLTGYIEYIDPIGRL